MKLLKPAGSTGRLFAGVYGQEGTGKTTIAIDLALTWREIAGLEGPIVFIDTEKGHQFHTAHVSRTTGQDMLVCETRNLDDVVPILVEAKGAGASVAIIDSITHFHKEHREREFERMGVKVPEPQDYGRADKPFKALLDKMLQSSSNLIICGRESVRYGAYKNKRGETKQGPIGTKMAAGDAGYEFDLLLHMKQYVVEGDKVYRTCTVKKDRRRDSDIDSKVFRVPVDVPVVFNSLFKSLRGGK